MASSEQAVAAPEEIMASSAQAMAALGEAVSWRGEIMASAGEAVAWSGELFLRGLSDRPAEAGERSERKPGVVTPRDGVHETPRHGSASSHRGDLRLRAAIA